MIWQKKTQHRMISSLIHNESYCTRTVVTIDDVYTHWQVGIDGILALLLFRTVLAQLVGLLLDVLHNLVVGQVLLYSGHQRLAPLTDDLVRDGGQRLLVSPVAAHVLTHRHQLTRLGKKTNKLRSGPTVEKFESCK